MEWLRAELQTRGQSTSGLTDALVKRLSDWHRAREEHDPLGASTAGWRNLLGQLVCRQVSVGLMVVRSMDPMQGLQAPASVPLVFLFLSVCACHDVLPMPPFDPLSLRVSVHTSCLSCRRQPVGGNQPG